MNKKTKTTKNHRSNLIFLGIAVLLTYLLLSSGYLFPDGQGYFSYLPSIFHSGDLQLYDDFVNMKIPIPLALTKNNYISNPWQIGTALFWAPFYFIARLFADTALSPYSSWFWLWTNFATMFYGLLSFFLLFKLCELNKTSINTKIVVFCAFIGTPMFFYSFFIGSTAHGISAFAVTAFIWFWLYSIKGTDAKRYIILGILLGLSGTVRQQELIFGSVVLSEMIFRFIKEKDIKREFKLGVVFILSLIAGMSPQFIVWKNIYGSFLASPAKFNLSFSSFEIFNVLFSPYHGILFWTPVYFIAFVGLVFGIRRKPEVFTGLTAALVIQIIVNSFSIHWWGGYSFGLRQLTSALPVILLGLSELNNYVQGKEKIYKNIFMISVILSGLWTACLLINQYVGLDLLGYVSAGEIIKTQLKTPVKLFEFVSKILTVERTAFGNFLLLMFGSGVIFLIFSNIFKFIQKEKTRTKVLGFIFALIIFYNIVIIKAHFNKPDYEIPTDSVVTERELGEFFVNQGEQIKKTFK